MPLQTPGAFFLGTLVASEQKFLKKVLVNAKKQGYNRFIEPCAGAFAMSHLAVQSGFKPEEIETSDVILFSSVFGYAMMDKPLTDLKITAEGFTKKELKDPATVLYALMLFKTTASATNELFFAMLKDLELRKDYHIKTIQEQIDRAKSMLKGINYRALDMYDHLDEIMDDPKAIIIINPPTYKAGFEKWYDTKGKVTWNEPAYHIFDPLTGLEILMKEKMSKAKALVLCYEENETGKFAGKPVFARYGVRKGVNVYLTTNDTKRAEELSEGKIIVRSKEKEIDPIPAAILPDDYNITEKTEIKAVKINPQEAFYHRAMWTHHFVGGAAQINMALLIDGYVAGVFGYQTAIGKKLSDIMIMYGMTRKHKTLRLNRLLTMVACNHETILEVVAEQNIREFDGVQTTQMTKYPESKEMRGLMKLVLKKKGKLGYKLVYKTDIKDRTYKETVSEFLMREKRWRKERSKSQKK